MARFSHQVRRAFCVKMMKKEIIKKGDRYGRLVAIRFDHKDKYSQQFWLFKCDCGNKKVINVSNVKKGDTKSCGCLRKEIMKNKMTTHGMSHTTEHFAWGSMKARCYNKNRADYKNYGGRDITICKRWLKFENFYEDMGRCPEGMTLDRIDNEKGYYKENCRWATAKEQANNRRSNRLLTYNGKTQNIKQWANELRINYGTLYSRIRYGWSVEKALGNN